MPNFKSISFKMAVLQGAGRICPPHVYVIQKTPCGIGLRRNLTFFVSLGIAEILNYLFLFIYKMPFYKPI